MLTPPQQNWDLYDEKCREEHVRWLRNLTPAAAMALYESFHSAASSQRGDSAGLERLEERRWEEKLAIRRAMCATFRKLDWIRRERRHSQNSG
jgi:hypothetical protein